VKITCQTCLRVRQRIGRLAHIFVNLPAFAAAVPHTIVSATAGLYAVSRMKYQSCRCSRGVACQRPRHGCSAGWHMLKLVYTPLLASRGLAARSCVRTTTCTCGVHAHSAMASTPDDVALSSTLAVVFFQEVAMACLCKRAPSSIGARCR